MPRQSSMVAAVLLVALGLAAAISIRPDPALAMAPYPTGAARDTLPFKASIHSIDTALKAKMMASGSWKPSCPVTLAQLKLIKVRYWGFDRRVHTGHLVVRGTAARKLITVFRKLYAARFKFRQIRLIDAFGASDRRSMRANNTSAFNGRYVSGTTIWSMHAYGLAIDINPVQNPWVSGTSVSPPDGEPYVDRTRKATGMIHANDVVVRAFRSIGWKWGGYWAGAKDYQHFSSTGG